MSLLPSLVAQTSVGTKAELMVIRKGKKKKITVKIGKLDEEGISSSDSPGESTSKKLGLTVQELTPELAQTLGVEDENFWQTVLEVSATLAVDPAGYCANAHTD